MKNNKNNSAKKTETPIVPEVQTGTNTVKESTQTETMAEIFELNQQPTFSKEVKRERLSDAWGKTNKK